LNITHNLKLHMIVENENQRNINNVLIQIAGSIITIISILNNS